MASTNNCRNLCLHVFLLLCCSCCYSLGAYRSTTADTILWGQSLSGNQTIVSKGGFFELGFFTPGKSQNYYIGIWYKQRPNKTVVWVANREKPLTNASSSELKISEDGNLVLLDQSKNQIWSSNLTFTASKSTAAVLLNTGNLVLVNRSDSSLQYWQSFDHPTDSWLPGGRVGWNNLTKEYMTLTSWRGPDDPSLGYYSFGVDPKGSNQMVQTWNGTVTYWKSGEWNGQFFSSLPNMIRAYLFNYTYVESERYITYTLTERNIITRFQIDFSGEGKQVGLEDPTADWVIAWSQPNILCQVYSRCGPFSICVENGTPLCQCLKGFEPASRDDWNSQYWNDGCARSTSLRCQKRPSNGEEDKFLMMLGVQMPVDSEALSVGSMDECKLACLGNCSCTAYAYNEEGSCSIWNGELINLRQFPDDNSTAGTIYIRLAASELQTSTPCESGKGVHVGVIIGAVGGFLVMLGIIVVLVWRSQRKGHSRVIRKAEERSLVLFTYRELQSLTKNFSEKLGGGGFGFVFKGILPNSSFIAVKKLEGQRQGEKQFRSEVSTMGTIQHVNLVHLRGFCCEGDKRLLVYEYMPNGSLDTHLFKNNSKLLCWKERYQVAIGTARGLAYLHEECRDCIIHCDLKPENILLDREFCPKVADFGMAKLMGREISKVLTTVRGTVGYLAPEWLSGLPITPKVDVYSFGMMLFELISGRRNATPNEDGKVRFFPIWAMKKVAEGEVLSLLDMRLNGNADMEELRRAYGVACWCIQDDESQRPSMGQVVQMLEGALGVSTSPIPRYLQHLVDDEDSTGSIQYILQVSSVSNSTSI